MNDVGIRWMTRHDFAEAAIVSKVCHSPACWDESRFNREFGGRNVLGMVAEEQSGGGVIVGVMAYELSRAGITLLHFAVAPSFQRRGVGRKMLAKLEAKLTPKGRRHAYATIPETDLGSQIFMRSCGWTADRIDRDAFGPGLHGYRFMVSADAGVGVKGGA